MTSTALSSWVRWCILLAIIWFSVEYIHAMSSYFSWTGYVGHPEWNRLLIPDTFFYRSVAKTGGPLDWLNSAVKNTAGPSLIWWIGRDSYLGVLFINALMLIAIPWQARRLALALEVPVAAANRLSIAVALLPASAYHMIGALKELPTTLLLLSLAVAHVRGENRKTVAYGLLLVFFRLQWLPILLLLGGLRKVAQLSAGSSLRVLLGFFALFPLVRRILPNSLLGPETVTNFRLERPGSGIGTIIETVRDNVPVLSVFAVMARTAQSLLEPLVSFINRGFSFVEDGRVSVLLVAYVLTTLMVLRPVTRIVQAAIMTLAGRSPTTQSALERLVMMVAVALLMIGGSSIVHFRYLTSMFPLVLVVGAALKSEARNRMPRSDNDVSPVLQ